LFFLSSGGFKAPAAMVSKRVGVPRFANVRLANTVAVVVRDNGDAALVDCGWSREVCAGPRRALGRILATAMGVDVHPGDALVDQLAHFGIERDRVRTIVATHFHMDHIGGAVDFPNAEVVSSDVELSAHRANAVQGYRKVDLEHARLRPVYLGSGPSYGFAASHDLFGDGEMVLLDAHGHTPGLVAVALRSRDRCYVHIGDAVYQSWEFGLSPAGPSRLAQLTAWRPDLMRARYANLRDCEADPRRPIIVPSHDDEVLAKLPHAPANEKAA
jgi:glyoxylase-like metal-dependent hydrolase (beta-lactamase superfamily II)